MARTKTKTAIARLSDALVSSGGERLCDIRKRGRAAFDKRIGRVSAHLLGLRSCTLRPKRLKRQKKIRGTVARGIKGQE
jgi:hypothetical protein